MTAPTPQPRVNMKEYTRFLANLDQLYIDYSNRVFFDLMCPACEDDGNHENLRFSEEDGGAFLRYACACGFRVETTVTSHWQRALDGRPDPWNEDAQ